MPPNAHAGGHINFKNTYADTGRCTVVIQNARQRLLGTGDPAETVLAAVVMCHGPGNAHDNDVCDNERHAGRNVHWKEGRYSVLFTSPMRTLAPTTTTISSV